MQYFIKKKKQYSAAIKIREKEREWERERERKIEREISMGTKLRIQKSIRKIKKED